MPKFAYRDAHIEQRLGSPDIMWGEGSNYGHITVYSWSQKSAEMRALSDAAGEAITKRIIAFLNESEPSKAERAYEVAVDAGRA